MCQNASYWLSLLLHFWAIIKASCLLQWRHCSSEYAHFVGSELSTFLTQEMLCICLSNEQLQNKESVVKISELNPQYVDVRVWEQVSFGGEQFERVSVKFLRSATPVCVTHNNVLHTLPGLDTAELGSQFIHFTVQTEDRQTLWYWSNLSHKISGFLTGAGGRTLAVMNLFFFWK